MKIAVIGCGPAGLIAALSAAMNKNTVTVFERNDSIGKKMLLTGNGKCNLTNTFFSDEYYSIDASNPKWKILEQFSPDEILHFFNDAGLLTTSKNGYIYPYSEQAKSVVNLLITRCRHYGVSIKCNSCIVKAEKREKKFYLYKKVDTKEQCIDCSFDRLILCCGGKAAPKTGSDGFGYRLARGFGHHITYTYPGLVQLLSQEQCFKALSGVRCHAKVTAMVNGAAVYSDIGEVQFIENGFSGIPIFQLSRFLSKPVEEKKACEIITDFFPEIATEDLNDYVLKQLELLTGQSVSSIFDGMIHPKISEYFLQKAGLDVSIQLTANMSECIFSILSEMKHWSIKISAHNGFEHAQITMGGVALDEIDNHLQSKLVAGLFFAGEMLDVDAACGGYNLQWAWASGRMAGLSCGDGLNND